MSKVTVDTGILNKKELETIQAQQLKLNTITQEIGYLEAKKHVFLHEIASANEEVDSYKKVLEEKYGSININLETGNWERIKEKDVEDKKD
jgi:hypothetical protein